MTQVKAVPTSSIDPDSTSGVAQFLEPVVIDLQALALNAKQAHWHVRGANFQAVHELLDEVHEHAEQYADEAAERVVALGLPIDARVATIAKKTGLPALTPGFQPAEKVIAEMVAQVDAALKSVRAAIDGLEKLDPASQDVAIEIARGLEKDRWFLFAHIATA